MGGARHLPSFASPKMGKNTNKPVRAPPPPSGGEADFEEKPFHSKEYEQAHLDSLINAKERPTWDEFKEIQRKKNEMDGDGAQDAAQRRFRQQLDEERAARLAERGAANQAEEKKKKSKKDKKEKKHKSKKEKKEKHKKEKHKKRRCVRPATRPSRAASPFVSRPLQAYTLLRLLRLQERRELER